MTRGYIDGPQWWFGVGLSARLNGNALAGPRPGGSTGWPVLWVELYAIVEAD